VLKSNENFSNLDKYMHIPLNEVKFYDIICKNARLYYAGNEIITNFALQFKEELIQGQLHFIAYIVEIGDLLSRKGHLEYNASDVILYNNHEQLLMQKANFNIGNNVEFVSGVLKN
jgi:hypothetical protein